NSPNFRSTQHQRRRSAHHRSFDVARSSGSVCVVWHFYFLLRVCEGRSLVTTGVHAVRLEISRFHCNPTIPKHITVQRNQTHPSPHEWGSRNEHRSDRKHGNLRTTQ